MRHSDYTNYLKGIATAHLSVKGFLRIIQVDWPWRNQMLEEFFSKMRDPELQFPIMISESYINRYKDNRGGEIEKHYSGAFLIIDKMDTPTDPDEIDTKYDACEEIAEDLIGYMIYEFEDNEDDSSSDTAGKRWFEPNDIMVEKIGMFGDGLLGVRVNFNFQHNQSMEVMYDATKFNWE